MMHAGWKQGALGLGLILTLAACQEYPFVFRVNQKIQGRSYDVQVGVSEQTDILFVIDNSGSMLEEQEELKANMQAFIELLSQSGNDYQVGLISTDIARKPPGDDSCEPCCDRDTNDDGRPDWSNCDNGRLYAADFKNRVFERPRLQEGEDPEKLQERIDALVEDFNETVTVLGIGGSPYEAPLEAMRRALDPEGNNIVRILNEGFLRPDASLAVIFLTDEDDCSFADSWYDEPTRDDADCYVAGGAKPVIDYVDFLEELKGTIEAVRAAAIIGGVPVPDAASDELGFVAKGCYTIRDPEAPDFGAPSDACGCWSSRYKTDTRPDESGDFFCNYLSEAPFNHPADRTPVDDRNQGGCRALPGSRIIQFVDEVRRRRLAEQLTPGVLADSICRADYSGTLEDIASTVVLSDCFLLNTPPEDPDMIELRRNGEVLPQVEQGADTPGWRYDPERVGVCLEGGLKKQVGDRYELRVVSETEGFESAGESASGAE